MNANEELRWLFHDSAAELGYASSLGPQLEALRIGATPSPSVGAMDPFAAWLEPGWISAAVLPTRQVHAASRQRWLLASFRKLQPRYQAAICIAYEQRHPHGEDDGAALVSRFGIAANIVRRLLRDRGTSIRWAEGIGRKEVKDAIDVLTEAHHVWCDIRRDAAAEARRDRDIARARGQRCREALLARLLGEPVDRELHAAAWLEALGLEQGDAETALDALTDEGRRRAEEFAAEVTT